MNYELRVNLIVAKTDTAKTLPCLPAGRQSPVNAGFFDMEWVMWDLTKSEVQQRLKNVVLCV